MPRRSHPPRTSAPSPQPRSGWLRPAGAVVLLVVGIGGYFFVSRLRGGDGPRFTPTPDQNVLLVTIDTLRADALGSYGGRAATPNLDRLASEGIRFTFAHAHAVVTLPSHTSIMTGRYPYEHGVRDNAGFRLDDGAETLAEVASRAGFATGAFVGAFPLDRQFGLAQGFDVYDDVGGREAAQGDFAFTERRAEEVVAAARQWIDAQDGRWLAWVHVFDPHAGYAPPPPFDSRYAGNGYAGEVAYVDHALGPLLDAARRGPRPTTVIVTADHGEGLGEHNEMTHGTFAYEGTLRVPLILAQLWPGSQTAGNGAVRDAPVRHVDILPTVTALLQLPNPERLAGASLLVDDGAVERPSYFEAMTPMLKRGWAPLSGIVAGREKYIDLPIEELYDLAGDPREEHNLVARAGERASAMAAQLRRLSAPLPGEQQSETAEVRARLQALGYVSGSAPRKANYTERDDPKRLIDVDRLMMDGIDLFRRRRMPEAMDAYRRVIARRPDMGLAYRRLAFLQWHVGAARDAIDTVRAGLKQTGPDIDLEVRLGTYLAESGSPAEAIPILEKVASADTGNAEALNALGIAYARQGRTADALRAFDRAIEANPRDVYAYENVGAVHLQRQDLEAAYAAFQRAVQNDDRSSRAHAGLGVVARHRGRSDEAIARWRRAVELDATNYDALFNLASELARAGRSAEARPYMIQFVQTAPPAFYRRDIERFRQSLAGSR